MWEGFEMEENNEKKGNTAALAEDPVFRHFLGICRIPHPSFKEKALSDAILAWAEARGIPCRQDKFHNLYLRKKASPGREQEPGFLLQAHLDMVCQKAPHVTHDFDKDPIRTVQEGDLVTTGGKTTLGADDGIGVALAMALLEADDLSHPELEVLFTTAEEDDFSGALNADIGWFHSRRVINLDNATETHATTGSAGGCCVRSERPVTFAAKTEDLCFMHCRVGGMLGGHSGEDIHRGRGSAIMLLSRLLQAAGTRIPLQLARLSGGNFRIAIARDAEAVVAFPRSEEERFLALWQKTGQELREEYGSVNPELFMTAEKIEKLQEPEKVLCPSETGEILQFLFLLPQGIQEMNGKVPGIVLTSINVGELYLDTEKGRFATVAEVRSAIASQRDAVAEKVKLLGRRFGMETGISCVYPGWRDNPDSPLTALLQERYQALFGRPLEATPVHVGLECGFFLAKRPELDCISIGPDAGNLHSPQEYVSIASTRRMYRFLRELLSFRN